LTNSNLILDRFILSEKVYCLQNRGYTIDDYYDEFIQELKDMNPEFPILHVYVVCNPFIASQRSELRVGRQKIDPMDIGKHQRKFLKLLVLSGLRYITIDMTEQTPTQAYAQLKTKLIEAKIV